MIVNLYEFLEIEPNASLEEVLAAIAQAEANDKNPKLILASKNLLCDAKRRNQYNESLKKHLAAKGITLDFSAKPKPLKTTIVNNKQELSEEQLIDDQLLEQNNNEPPIHALQKKMTIGAIIFVVALLGLAIYYVPQYWAIRTAKIAAEQRLIDPTSHLFRDIEYHSAIIREDKRGFVCGYVNGKNRMGAYTGFTGFIYSVDNKDIFHQPNDKDGDYANKMFLRSWQVACLGDDYTKHFIDLENLDKNVDKVGKKIEDLIQKYQNNELTKAEFSEQSEPLREELNGLLDTKTKGLLIPGIFVKQK